VFQDVFAIELPWAEVGIGAKGKMNQMKCRICHEVEKKKNF
jgi:hypothetical protein